MMRRLNDEQLRLGIFFPAMSGPHVISRTIAAENPDNTDPDVMIDVAQTCEDVGLDFIFLADSWSAGEHCAAANFHDPVWYPPLLLGALATCTREIGLVSTVHTALHHPTHIARMAATLDHLSGGRWGINVVSGGGAGDELLGIDALDHDARYRRARELTDAITVLWEGDEVDLHGEHLDVTGALNVPPRAQDRPLVISAGTSPAGLEFAARSADWLFISGPDGASTRTRIAAADRLAQAAGRPPGSIRPMMLGDLVVRDTDAEAEAVRQDVRSKVDLDAAREFAIGIMGSIDAYRELFERDEDPEVLRDYGSKLGRQQFYGSPQRVAAEIVRVHREFGAKGLAFTFPYWAPEQIRRCLEPVLPLLEDAGVWTSPKRKGWTWG